MSIVSNSVSNAVSNSRQLVSLLPVVNQTDTIKNFFDSTVNPLFQPGQSEPISGYIGEKPVYYDPQTDFYIDEPTAARQFYQLEPAMLSINSAGIITDSLTYDDLISYLVSQGAIVDNESKLFEGDYYSWAPPCDIDKLSNYLQYYWMGSLTEAEQANTAITLYAPRTAYSYDGSGNQYYPLPPVITTFGSTGESPMVLVNGELVSSNFVDGEAQIDVSNVAVGSIIETIRYGDLTLLMQNATTFDYSPFLAWQGTAPDYQNGSITSPNYYPAGQLVSANDNTGTLQVYICVTPHSTLPSFLQEISYWQLAVNGRYATSGSRVRLVDGLGTTEATARYFFVEGVGSSIQLCADYTSDIGGSAPQYVVIDRRSREQSPWTRRNLWVHKDTLLWTNQDYSYRVAKLPIIEYLPNMELYNYGYNRLADVQATLSNATAEVEYDWDIYPFNDGPWDNSAIVVSQINGQFFGRLYDNYTNAPVDAYSNTYVGSVLVDNNYPLQPNDRLFVHQTVSQEPELNNYVYTVVNNPQTPLQDGALADVMELVVEQPVLGDIFRIEPTPNASVFTDPVEYWYNGSEWVIAQNGASLPLFRLYDYEENPLDDVNVYPGTTFAGSKLFSYEVGNGTANILLGFPIVYDQYSNPVFEVDPIVNPVTYANGVIEGYYYHHFLWANNGVGTFSNNWFIESNASVQTVEDGFYTVPLNLQANPGNFEVSNISYSQWFDQFSEIMLSQPGFVGQPYTANNWRDTIRYLGNGQEILQHRSPLLKTMLISANQDFDLPASLRYVELEASRFRNKFVQTIANYLKNGTLLASQPASAWLAKILLAQRVNKNTLFPFAYSNMAGGQYFIPPTVASFGLTCVAVPSLYTDTTYPNPVPMIRGHDGSLTPAFGDFRDNIILALEQQIYNNIPAKFKTEARPVFDLEAYIGGKFYTAPLGFTRQQIDSMIAPYFINWAQRNGFDYRTNNSYVAGQPFTWNYSSSLDADGAPVPGFWRGIYKLYFDTDRPHLAPWEMLGFIDKPSYWDASYGPAPYTAGNSKLWTDLQNGYIAGGVRQGVDPRYARPLLDKYLPVDLEGNLLDPIAAGIIPTAPTYGQATAPWKAGDYGPVESLWRQSISFPYAMAQASFLAKPSRFVEQGWDTINQIQDSTGQWIYSVTGNRPQDAELYVHGEVNPTTNAVVTITGISQWIGDYMVSKGQSTSNFGSAVRGLTVQLAHKMAGYVSQQNLTISSDNFGLIPAEDFSVNLYTSPSLQTNTYSGVLVEYTGNGYRVIGYNSRDPNFYVIPPVTSGPKGVISLATEQEAVITPWLPKSYYPINTIVSYNGAIYQCIKSNTSGTTFDLSYWQLSGVVPPQAPRVTTYLLGQTGVVNAVPYGTVLQTYQDVSDFLLGYERWLKAQGWVFNQIDPNTNTTIDWTLMVYEFLGWAQVSWQVGNFISLSPGSGGLIFQTDQGMITNILDSVNGAYGLIDRTGAAVSRKSVVVNRNNDYTEILSKTNDIFGATVNISEMEHLLIFNNSTIFGNLIYDPLFNLRQPRLLLIGRRTTDWDGRLNMPGYVLLNSTTIASNFDKASQDLLTMWDIENADNDLLSKHTRLNIGYSQRQYLADLVLSDVEQFEFYQGLIHQKGTVNAFNALLRSSYIENEGGTLNFFEEWGIKINQFGAINTDSRIAFLFGQSSVLRDPQYVEFRSVTNASTVTDIPPYWIEIIDSTTTGLDPQWVERPSNPLQAFPQRTTYSIQPGDLPVAGYVRLSEIDYTIFSVSDLETVYNANNSPTLLAGEVIWIHDNTSQALANTTVSTPWYLVGVETVSGYWTTTGADAQVITLDTIDVITTLGESVFQSEAYTSPTITDYALFTTSLNQIYTASFNVIKTVEGSTASYLQPSFTAFDGNGNSYTLLGTASGFGYNAELNIIDTSNWIIGQTYQVNVSWIANSSIYLSAYSCLRLNRTLNDDPSNPSDPNNSSSNAIFQVASEVIVSPNPTDWDALKIYNLSIDGSVNYITNVVTQNENPSLGNTTVRIFTSEASGLSAADVGLYVIIDGSTKSEPDLQGINMIANVGVGYIDIAAPVSNVGYNFTSNLQQGPPIRIMRSIHFTSQTAFAAAKNRYNLQAGDLAYVDGSPWQVYILTETEQSVSDWLGNVENQVVSYWDTYRSQPYRVDASQIEKACIYNLQTTVTNTSILPQPLVVDYLSPISPLTGILPGKAMDQIDYLTDYDPATYDYVPIAADIVTSAVGTENLSVGVENWGPAQVGRVWWDISTVRFLETDTDNVIFNLTGSGRYNEEIQYRITNWGQIAPNTSVDIYEWYRSDVDPYTYTNAALTDTTGTYGQVYNADTPSWNQAEEYVGTTPTTFYYFWVKNLTVVPNVSFRSLSVQTLGQFIVNPMIEDEPWIAPVAPNGVLVGGVETFVDDVFDTNADGAAISGSVVQIQVKDPANDAVQHDQWMLMRNGDELSIPPNWLWDKIRDSLVGFNDQQVATPVSATIPTPVVSQVNKPPVWYTGPGSNDVPIE